MEVHKLEEAGFDAAMYGFSLSYRKKGLTRDEWWTVEQKKRTIKAALANADRDGGHNKFLEHMQIWLAIEANLEWWKQFDTYRIGVSKQSESTMHTLSGEVLAVENFDLFRDEFETVKDWNIYTKYLNMLDRQNDRTKSKGLPQAYCQEREVTLSYKVIRHIKQQRMAHKLPNWIGFLKQTIKHLDHPEFIK